MTVTSDSDFFSARRSQSEAPDSYDALADLFLGQVRPTRPHLRISGEPKPPEEFADVARPIVETLVLGHLPVLSGPWATTYAALEARNCSERVALIRLVDGRVSVDMMNDEEDWNVAIRSVDDAFRAVAHRADRIILRTDVVNEPVTTSWDEADEVTVLTSADEAAIVDAYTILKKLASEFEPVEPEDATADAEGPLLKVAIVGADEDRAQRTFEKLSRAANAFLSYPICEAAIIERIETTRSRRVFRSEEPLDIESLLELLNGALSMRPEDAPSELHTTPEPPAKPVDQIDDVTSFDISVEEFEIGSPALEVETPSSRSLARFLNGLSPICARCPYDESIELAVDDEGRLHLLTQADAMAVESLSIVEEWADAHAAIIQQASAAEARMDPSLGVHRHLFTDDAPSVRRLLDTPLHVHLLTRVELDRDAGWICRDLN